MYTRSMRITLLLFLFLIGCQPTSTPAKPPISTDACDAAENHLLNDLECPDGRGGMLGGPTKKGKSWAQLCKDDAANGVDLHAACLAMIGKCSEADACLR